MLNEPCWMSHRVGMPKPAGGLAATPEWRTAVQLIAPTLLLTSPTSMGLAHSMRVAKLRAS